MSNDLAILGVSILSFVVLSLLVLISVKSRLFLVAYIPIMIGMVVAAYVGYGSVLGFPSNGQLPIDFRLHAFVIDKPKAIYLWVQEKGDVIPRSYVIKYTPGSEKKLQSNARAIAEGTVFGSGRSQTNGGSEQNPGEFVLYDYALAPQGHTKQQQ